MKNLNLFALLALILLMGCSKEDLLSFIHDHHPQPQPQVIVQHTDLVTFLPAGELGGSGNVLEPGTVYPPTDGGKATLKRGKDYIEFDLHTTGLPEGAYTIWYALFNDPAHCSDGMCSEDDLFNPTTAVMWATGGVVKSDGVGKFHDKLMMDERREPVTQEPMVGEALDVPLQNPQGAEIHLIVKYHGLPSSDPDVLYDQLHTLLGSCGEDGGANSFDAGEIMGFQCFDPQAALFPAP